MKKSLKTGLTKLGRGAKVVLRGDAVDSRFFRKHFFITAFTVITCMLFIAARIDHATTARDIRRINIEIAKARTEKQKEVSRYHTLTRESTMRRLVDSLHLGLDVPEASRDERPGTLTLD